jgi:hypothetical protein
MLKTAGVAVARHGSRLAGQGVPSVTKAREDQGRGCGSSQVQINCPILQSNRLLNRELIGCMHAAVHAKTVIQPSHGTQPRA